MKAPSSRKRTLKDEQRNIDACGEDEDEEGEVDHEKEEEEDEGDDDDAQVVTPKKKYAAASQAIDDDDRTASAIRDRIKRRRFHDIFDELPQKV